MSDSVTNNLETLFAKMENFISSKTVVGEAINMNGVIILPLVDVVFGVGAGGGAANTENEKSDKQSGGGGGLGAKITPSALLVIQDGNVQLVNIKNQDTLNKLIDMVPGIVSKLNFFGKDKNTEKDSTVIKETVFEEKIIKEDTL